MSDGSGADGKHTNGAAWRAGRSKPEASGIPAAGRAPRIALAEDDTEMRSLLGRWLRQDGYDVTEIQNGNELIARLDSTLAGSTNVGFDLVISDIRMPGISGLDALNVLRTSLGSPPVVLITAFGDSRTHAEAERLGAVAVFNKPFAVDDLRTFVRGALRVSRRPMGASPDQEVRP